MSMRFSSRSPFKAKAEGHILKRGNKSITWSSAEQWGPYPGIFFLDKVGCLVYDRFAKDPKM
jgi:hypothetical protein